MKIEQLNENNKVLNEAPWTNGAAKRAVNRADKDELARRKKVMRVLAKDFSKDWSNALFYLPKFPTDAQPTNRKDPLSQKDWIRLFRGTAQEFTTSNGKDDPKFVLWHDALVTSSSGMLLRRGAEDLSKNVTYLTSGNGKGDRDFYMDERNSKNPSSDAGDDDTGTSDETFTITAERGEGYSVTPVEGDPTKVPSGGSFKFKVNINDGYTAGDKFVVTANDTRLRDSSGLYTLENIRTNIIIKVEGVIKQDEELPPDDGDGDKPPKKPPVDYSALVTDETVERFKRLVALAKSEGYDFKVIGPDKKELSKEQLDALTRETILNIRVPRGGKYIKFGPWYQSTRSLKLLEDTSLENLKEALLMEAPRITYTPDDMFDPDIAPSISDKLRQAVEQERAEKAAAEKAKKQDELRQRHKGLLSAVTSALEDPDKKPSDVLEILFEATVPYEGKSEIVAGELTRAMMRVLYRDYNDGDKFFEGYGLETCAPSVSYLCSMISACDTFVETILDNSWKYDNDDEYTKAIEHMCSLVINYILNNPELLAEPNSDDSRDYDYEWIEEQQPRYEFEWYASDDVELLVEENILDAWDLNSYVESSLEYETACDGCEVDRPFTHSSTSGTISNLTKEGYERCEDMFRNVDSFWHELVEEHREELEHIKNGDDEESDEDDYDSSYDDSVDENYFV